MCYSETVESWGTELQCAMMMMIMKTLENTKQNEDNELRQ